MSTSPATYYREREAFCLEKAKSASDEAARASWTRAAENWAALASQEERDTAVTAVERR